MNLSNIVTILRILSSALPIGERIIGLVKSDSTGNYSVVALQDQSYEEFKSLRAKIQQWHDANSEL